jgi:hypothetical protein
MAVGETIYAQGRSAAAAEVFRQVALSREFVEFIPLHAHNHIDP